ncbi:hypothetical protein RB594_000289 [Gaeumannomyces avenae]
MSSDTINRPRVGVAAVIARPNGSVILGRRKGSHGSGQWAFPGGHLEFGESIVACAERETLEETGLHVKGVKIAGVTNSVFTDTQLHYVTLFVQCEPCDPSQELQPQMRTSRPRDSSFLSSTWSTNIQTLVRTTYNAQLYSLQIGLELPAPSCQPLSE